MTGQIERFAAAVADRYAIEREIGAGGMATVYLAEDVKHHRKVAVKVLRPELAAVLGAERFLKEIEVTANLQHPHILQLYDSGEVDRFLFYVMPFVDGESLREKLDREKQLGVEEAIKLAEGVAAALDYAHRHDVIHRDIKPENILLHDDQPVVADFGIALAVTAAGGERLTETGLTLGTPQYMSPEQATGDRVDARTDVYSLGAVVYEMLVGEPPHTGGTVQAIIAQIISAEPKPITRVRGAVATNVDAAVRRALAKVPADRFLSAPQFAKALVDPSFRVGTSTKAVAPHSRTGSVVYTSVGLVVGILLGFGFANLSQSAPSSLDLNLRLPFVLSGYNGEGSQFKLTPNCTGIVHADRVTGGISLREFDHSSSTPVTRVGRGLMVSPDGKSVAFFAGGAGNIHRVPIKGGEPIMLGRLDERLPGSSWGADGYIYLSNGVIQRIPATGGMPEPVTMNTDRAVQHQFPVMLPGAEGLVYTRRRGRDSATIMLQAMPNGPTTEIGIGVTARYSKTGHLLIGQLDGSLQAVPFDVDNLEVTGAAVTIETDVYVFQDGQASFSICGDGVLVVQRAHGVMDLVLVDELGRQRSVAEADDFTWPSFSPDEMKIAVSKPDASGVERVWVIGLDGSETRLSRGDANAFNPRWSPSGDSLTFNEGGRQYIQRSDGSGTASAVEIEGMRVTGGDWAPDGRSMTVMARPQDSGNWDMWLFPLDGGIPRVLAATNATDGPGRFAPNGRHIAYRSGSEVWVVDSWQPDSKWLLTEGGGGSPHWTTDGRLFYDNHRGTLMAATVELEPAFRVLRRDTVLHFGDLNNGQYDVSRDGRTIVSYRPKAWAQLELITNWTDRFESLGGR